MYVWEEAGCQMPRGWYAATVREQSCNCGGDWQAHGGKWISFEISKSCSERPKRTGWSICYMTMEVFALALIGQALLCSWKATSKNPFLDVNCGIYAPLKSNKNYHFQNGFFQIPFSLHWLAKRTVLPQNSTILGWLGCSKKKKKKISNTFIVFTLFGSLQMVLSAY